MKISEEKLSSAKYILEKILHNANPVISVITPVLNGQKHIEGCIKKVMSQDLTGQIEHIICDAGSADNTLDIVRKYAVQYPYIRVISFEGINQGKAMNEAIKLARGSIIATLNVEDFYSPGALKEVIEQFNRVPDGSFLAGNLKYVNENNEVRFIYKSIGLNLNDIIWERVDYPWNSSAYFYHKSLHEKIGYYDEEDDYVTDLDFLLRILQSARVIHCDRNWGNFRYFPGIKNFKDGQLDEYWKARKEVLDRFRKAEIPQFPKRLPGTLWGITAYFNSDKNKDRYDNFLKFRASSQRQGLKLLVVELEFDDQPFEVKKQDADILLQFRGDQKNFVWQKEALMNVALKNLPDECDKVAWIDGDVLFKNENWVKQTSQLLEKYKVVQPFSWAIYLKEGQKDADPLMVPFGFGEGKQFYSMAYRAAECGQQQIGLHFKKNGHVGFGWACRREVIEELSFLDSTIFQNNDSLMAFSFYGSWEYFQWHLNSCLPPETFAWTHKAWETVHGSVYYCPGVILHLWHGDIGLRIYDLGRYDYLFELQKASKFEFNKDLSKNKDGLWEWVGSSGGIFREELKNFYKGKPVGKNN